MKIKGRKIYFSLLIIAVMFLGLMILGTKSLGASNIPTNVLNLGKNFYAYVSI